MSTSNQITFSILSLPYNINSASIFSSIRNLGWPIWLDSGSSSGPEAHGRYDILSAAPSKKIVSDSESTRCLSSGEIIHHKDAWMALKSEYQTLPSTVLPELPFVSGFLGYLGYDLGRKLESLTDRLEDDSDLPFMQMGYYDWAIIRDHERCRTTLVYSSAVDRKWIDNIVETVSSTQIAPSNFKVGAIDSNFRDSEYRQSVDQIRKRIASGECYQVNFAQRFTAKYKGDLLSAYLKLRSQLPSPFSCFFETEYGAVLSLSPERFIHLHDDQVTTQPIKGTIHRSPDPVLDRELANQLSRSVKNRAENLMIVDLLRNDLSKICQHDSVRVDKLFELQSFANVHHLVSTISGTLKQETTPIDALMACYPGGSITGAPKIKAMEVIEELEPNRRSVYCGSIGYIDGRGRSDTNIAIRTIVANKSSLYVWGGGGIVYDSDPSEEYQESITKIGIIINTLKAIS